MKKILSILFIAMLSVVGISADGTGVGTEVENYGTLHFQVNHVDQDEINSTKDLFKVDKKINFIVETADGTIVGVQPNQKDAVLTFHLRNNGNSVQDFGLYYVADNGNDFSGKTDDSNMTYKKIYVESGATAGYQSAEDTAEYVDELAVDTNTTVYMLFDIPSNRVDGNVSDYTLIAEARIGDTAGKGDVDQNDSGADDPLAIQTVWADPAGTYDAAKDGNNSDHDAFEVQAAVLNFEKTSIVVDDYVSGDNFKRIPGALIRYCFELNNTGTQDATDLYWEDNVSATLTVVADTAKYTDDLDDRCEECSAITNSKYGNGGDTTGNDVRYPTGTTTITVAHGKTRCAFVEANVK